MGRAGTADEVAEIVIWLLHREASYVTDSFIDVAGGALNGQQPCNET